jgi:thiamine-monophosphate kinase
VDEFDIIRHYFAVSTRHRSDVIAGIGDDAALLRVPPGQDLVVCTDTLVSGVHFPERTAAAAIGHKALAVNLSDLAAMGAQPAWATLALTLPAAGADWLEQFAGGLLALAQRCNVELVGGDTTRGPLTVTVTAHGLVPHGTALRRRGARVGDRVYVTGTLGDAGLALQLAGRAPAALQARLDYPEPRIEAGQALRGFATAAIDVSDGLLADLGHLLDGDDLGATLDVDSLPRSAAFLDMHETPGVEPHPAYYELPLAAGDDYELCFTVPPAHGAAIEQRLEHAGCPATAIGVITDSPGIRCVRAGGRVYTPATTGYRHFTEHADG